MVNITDLFNNWIDDGTEDIRKNNLVIVVGKVTQSVMDGIVANPIMGTAFRCEVVQTEDTFDLRAIVDYLEEPRGIDIYVSHCTPEFRHRLYLAASNSLGHNPIDRSVSIALYEMVTTGNYECTARHYFIKSELFWAAPMSVV